MKLPVLLFMLFSIFTSFNAYAIKTASSFDASWAYVPGLSLDAYETATGNFVKHRTLASTSGVQIDYNIALFDYRTVASFSFTQLADSNLGSAPFSRIALGVSYHLFRINGQRMLLDNQVESRIWGISPALELSLGINKLTINDPSDKNFVFAASLVDAVPRLLIEIPMSSTFLLMLRAGTYVTLKGANAAYNIKLSGLLLNIGFKLTTL